jgi:hypothetical protein
VALLLALRGRRAVPPPARPPDAQPAAALPAPVPVPVRDAGPAGAANQAGWSPDAGPARHVSTIDVFDHQHRGPADANRDGQVIGGSQGGRCQSGWCWESPLPDGSPVHALWGAAADDLWAVGESVSHWDGRRWSPVTLPGAGDEQVWYAVHGCSARDVWIAGHDGQLVHFDGSAWTPVQSGTTRPLLAVWCRGPDDLWVAGDRGLLRHHDGQRWSAPRVPGRATLYRLFGRTADDAWAVGDSSTVLHFDGRRWTSRSGAVLSQQPLPHAKDSILGTLIPRAVQQALTSVWAAAADDVWVSGYQGLFHWDGQRWSRVEVPTRRPLGSLFGFSARDVWAAGHGRILRFDGQAWRRVEGDGSRSISALFGARPDDIWMGGQGGWLRWDGRQVARAQLASNDTFWAVHASGRDQAWAAGDQGALARLQDGLWRWVTVPGERPPSFRRIWSSGPDDVWFLSSGRLFRWDGRRLAPVRPLDARGRELSVFDGASAAPGQHWLCHTGGLSRYDGRNVQPAEPIVTGPGELASCSRVLDAGRRVLAAFGSVLWQRGAGGAGWARVRLPGKHDDLRALAASGPEDVWVSDRAGVLFHFDGQKWSRVPVPARGDVLHGMFVPGPGELWLWGYSEPARASAAEVQRLAELYGIPRSKINPAAFTRPVILHWKNGRWTSEPLRSLHLLGIGGGGGRLWRVGRGLLQRRAT